MTRANGPFCQVLGGLRSASCGQPSGKAIRVMSRTAMPAIERPVDVVPGRISCGSADWHCMITMQTGLQSGVGGQSSGQHGSAIAIGAAISAVRAAADAKLACTAKTPSKRNTRMDRTMPRIRRNCPLFQARTRHVSLSHGTPDALQPHAARSAEVIFTPRLIRTGRADRLNCPFSGHSRGNRNCAICGHASFVQSPARRYRLRPAVLPVATDGNSRPRTWIWFNRSLV